MESIELTLNRMNGNVTQCTIGIHHSVNYLFRTRFTMGSHFSSHIVANGAVVWNSIKILTATTTKTAFIIQMLQCVFDLHSKEYVNVRLPIDDSESNAEKESAHKNDLILFKTGKNFKFKAKAQLNSNIGNGLLLYCVAI